VAAPDTLSPLPHPPLQGLIERATRLVQWCPVLQTVISDIEVDMLEVEADSTRALPSGATLRTGVLYSIAYQLEGETGGELVVATTRPETILGDAAVAVHPDDPRHSHLIGRR